MLLRSNFSSFPYFFLHVVRFSCLGRDQIFTSRKAVIQDKRGRDSESQLYYQMCDEVHLYEPLPFTVSLKALFYVTCSNGANFNAWERTPSSDYD